jgi:uncharacterized membrane protein YozB (DUF420 family)
MKPDQTNIRAIVLISILAVYFSLITWLPYSFYHTDVYQPFWNGLTNVLIFTFYVVAAGWILFNARQKNKIMLAVSTASILTLSFLFFNLFVYSFVG